MLMQLSGNIISQCLSLLAEFCSQVEAATQGKRAHSLQAELDTAQACSTRHQQEWNSYKLQVQVCCQFRNVVCCSYFCCMLLRSCQSMTPGHFVHMCNVAQPIHFNLRCLYFFPVRAPSDPVSVSCWYAFSTHDIARVSVTVSQGLCP